MEDFNINIRKWIQIILKCHYENFDLSIEFTTN